MFREAKADKGLYLFVMMPLYFEDKNHLKCLFCNTWAPEQTYFPRRGFPDDAYQNCLGTTGLHELSDHSRKYILNTNV